MRFTGRLLCVDRKPVAGDFSAAYGQGESPISMVVGDATKLPKKSASRVTIFHPDNMPLIEGGLSLVEKGGEIFIATDGYGGAIRLENVIESLVRSGFMNRIIFTSPQAKRFYERFGNSFHVWESAFLFGIQATRDGMLPDAR